MVRERDSYIYDRGLNTTHYHTLSTKGLRARELVVRVATVPQMEDRESVGSRR